VSVDGRVVVVAGASSVAGRAVCAELTAAGARVVAVGTDAGRLDDVDASRREVCDLADHVAVVELAARVRADLGGVDGLIHLVGGWRGGNGLEGQTDDDWDADLQASDAGRLAIVSSTAVQRPYPGGANYSTAKIAAETWVRAVDRGFSKAGSPARTTIFVVKALGGLEHALGRRVVRLWTSVPPERDLIEG
jgi:3-oxoacyl-[acyl-carrier protein] reductase